MIRYPGLSPGLQLVYKNQDANKAHVLHAVDISPRSLTIYKCPFSLSLKKVICWRTWESYPLDFPYSRFYIACM